MKKFIFIVLLCLIASVVHAGEIYELNNTLDGSTKYQIVIDSDHHEVHEGESFYAYFNSTSTDTNALNCIVFNTPNTTKWAHMIWTAHSDTAGTLEVYENPSVDVDEGTAFTVINRNRNSTEASKLTSNETAPVANKVTTYNATQSATANITTTTTIFSQKFGSSGNPVTTTGGESRGRAEYVLDQNQQYAVCIKDADDNDSVIGLELQWYEHTDNVE